MNQPVEVKVPAEMAELVADQLFQAGASAVSEQPGESGTDEVTLVADPDPHLLARSGLDWRPLTIAASEGAGSEHAGSGAGSLDMLRVGDFAVLVDAAGAFGSGSHATTRLCADLVVEAVASGGTVLDVGSGSGVLAVAAVMAGATNAVAIDVDPAAVLATRRTAAANGVADRVVASATPLDSLDGEFDVVFANLLIPIIEQLGPQIVGHVAPHGVVVLSGILDDQVDRAIAAVAPLQVLGRRIEVVDSTTWAALTLVRT